MYKPKQTNQFFLIFFFYICNHLNIHTSTADSLSGNWNKPSIENLGNTGNQEVNKIIQQFPQDQIWSPDLSPASQSQILTKTLLKLKTREWPQISADLHFVLPTERSPKVTSRAVFLEKRNVGNLKIPISCGTRQRPQ